MTIKQVYMSSYQFKTLSLSLSTRDQFIFFLLSHLLLSLSGPFILVFRVIKKLVQTLTKIIFYWRRIKSHTLSLTRIPILSIEPNPKTTKWEIILNLQNDKKKKHPWKSFEWPKYPLPKTPTYQWDLQNYKTIPKILKIPKNFKVNRNILKTFKLTKNH